MTLVYFSKLYNAQHLKKIVEILLLKIYFLKQRILFMCFGTKIFTKVSHLYTRNNGVNLTLRTGS